LVLESDSKKNSRKALWCII